MPGPDQALHDAPFAIEPVANEAAGGTPRRAPQRGAADLLRLSGALRVVDTPVLRGALQQFPAAALDLTELVALDGAGAALIQAHVRRGEAEGRTVALRGLENGVGLDIARQLALYDCGGDVSCLKPVPRAEGVLHQIGGATVGIWCEIVLVLAFVGQLAAALSGVVRRPRSVPWGDVPRLMNRAGADGLAIVVVVNFLLGFTIALSGAVILARYGANVFVAELVGFSVLRELGPLMTAILVAGRSGASYAAELGTMQVGEEVDALRTMALEPVRYLVLPRVLALLIVVPMLTVVADVVAIAGGGLVAITTLDLTTTIYLGRLQDSVGLVDVVFGLAKSAGFALVIALVACQRGLATRGGAAGVGLSTTSAVVVALFLLVGVNAGCAGLAELMGW